MRLSASDVLLRLELPHPDPAQRAAGRVVVAALQLDSLTLDGLAPQPQPPSAAGGAAPAAAAAAGASGNAARHAGTGAAAGSAGTGQGGGAGGGRSVGKVLRVEGLALDVFEAAPLALGGPPQPQQASLPPAPLPQLAPCQPGMSLVSGSGRQVGRGLRERAM